MPPALGAFKKKPPHVAVWGGANNPGVSGKDCRENSNCRLENIDEDLVCREYVGIRVVMTSRVH